jgi:hypothetical protein
VNFTEKGEGLLSQLAEKISRRLHGQARNGPEQRGQVLKGDAATPAESKIKGQGGKRSSSISRCNDLQRQMWFKESWPRAAWTGPAE